MIVQEKLPKGISLVDPKKTSVLIRKIKHPREAFNIRLESMTTSQSQTVD